MLLLRPAGFRPASLVEHAIAPVRCRGGEERLRSDDGPSVIPARTAAVVAVVGFLVIVAFQAALALGAPLGQAAWGGAHRRLPPRLRVGSAVAVTIWLLAGSIVLGRAGFELVSLPSGVERWGAVSNSELASLYRRAAVLVFPSLYEGFGMPPLEAMASGCPVAAASVGAIPEVCGDAAVLFDPLDPEALVAGILEADERSAELREKGLAHAARFTWSETARMHEDAYVAAANDL